MKANVGSVSLLNTMSKNERDREQICANSETKREQRMGKHYGTKQIITMNERAWLFFGTFHLNTSLCIIQ